MAADAWDFYNVFTEYIGDGTCDLDNDAFKMALFLSTSNCATLTLDAYASFTNEHANANGYTTGGEALDNVVWTRTAGSTKLDCDNEVWTASGGSHSAISSAAIWVIFLNGCCKLLQCSFLR